VAHHSTCSKNRHERFAEPDLFGDLFKEDVHCCMDAGLVEAESFSVDGSLIEAAAGPQSRVLHEELAEAAKASTTVQTYLAELERQNPVAEDKVSASDPEATWAAKDGQPRFAC
jgi:hypothetical protein